MSAAKGEVLGEAARELDGKDSVAAEAEAYLVLRRLTGDVLGTPSAELSSIDEVVRLAKHGLAVLANQADVKARLDALQSRVETLEDERAQLQGHLDDALLGQAEEVESATRLQDHVRYLQRALARAGQSEAAWSEVPPDELTNPPSSFTELIERLTELRHVVVTDDLAPAIELDVHDVLGSCAAKAWDALLALDDYAEARRQEIFGQGIHAYLKETPPGYHGYPANRHAPAESASVENNPKYHDARMFAMPTTVDASGKRYMGAHFKLGAKKTISPRLHYFDAVSIDGKVYVGYIGRHLPSPQTN